MPPLLADTPRRPSRSLWSHLPRARAWLRAGGWSLLAILALGLLLRLPGLSWLPAPNGDEANWANYAAQAASSQAVEFQPDHKLNSPAPAYLLAAVMRVAGANFFHLRLTGALAVMLAALLCQVLLYRVGASRVGLGLAAVLAIHPWSVIWSRTVSVPYAIALAGMTLGAVAFWVGLRSRSPWTVGLGMVVTALAAHFSPLAALMVPPCLLFALRRQHRWIFRHPVPLAAAVVGLALVVPLLIWIRQSHIAVTGPGPVTLKAGIEQAAQMTLAGVIGENSVRHFTNIALQPARAAQLGAALLLPLLLFTGSHSVRRVVPEARFGLALLASGALLLPLALAPGREWHMPNMDADRYSFVLLPGLGLCLGALLQADRRWWRLLLALGMAAVLLVGSGRILGRLAWGSGSYKGSASGGECYYGWLTSQDHEAPAVTVAKVAARTSVGTVLYDGYPMRIVGFTLRRLPVAHFRFDQEGEWSRRSGRFLFVLWADVVNPPATKRTAGYRALLSNGRFRNARHERTLHQPDGSPLLELWTAER